MVKFMVKWVIASIPAMLVLLIIGLIVGFAVAGLTTGVLSRFMSGSGGTDSSALTSDTGGFTSSDEAPLSATVWSLTESTDPATVTLALAASSLEGTEGREAPALILRCTDGKTEAYIDWHTYLAMDSATVSTTVGDATAVEQPWSVSTDSEASFFPGSPQSFIMQLLDAEKLVATTTPFGESAVTATFGVKGLSDTIEPLRKACGW
ncbi:MAG: hypothetical protein FIB01_07175 [Gemmatimonadetes bacterium]|nr:hypothetical protein [Gemmatimonadota bacterium]